MPDDVFLEYLVDKRLVEWFTLALDDDSPEQVIDGLALFLVSRVELHENSLVGNDLQELFELHLPLRTVYHECQGLLEFNSQDLLQNPATVKGE